MKKSFIQFFVFFIVLFLMFEIHSYLNRKHIAIEKNYNTNKNVYTNLLYFQEQNLRILSEAIVSCKAVKTAYIQNKPEIIKQNYQNLWKKALADKHIYEMHFFKPPATSFVNFSNYKSTGTDLSKTRTDTKWVTDSMQESFHPFVCKTYVGFRNTTPILDSNKSLLGGLSIGKNMDWLPEKMKKRTANESFILYVKNATTSLMQKYYLDFIKDKQVVGNYILADSTITIDPKSIQKIDFTKNIQFINIDNTRYALYLYPVIGFNKDTIAYLFVLDNLSDFYTENLHILKTDIFVFLFFLLLLFIILKIKLAKILKYIDKLIDFTKHIKNREFSILRDEQKKKKTK